MQGPVRSRDQETDERMTMPDAKKCTKCKESKKLEDYPIDQRRSDGRKSQCKKCGAAYGQKKYMERHIPKTRPILLSWQLKPSERFNAYLVVATGKSLCILSPFVCESNEDTVVICTAYNSRWKLDKSEYIFSRPN